MCAIHVPGVPNANEIYENEPSIDGAMASDSPKLVAVEKPEFRCVVLKPIGQDLGQKFSQGVKKSDGAIRFWNSVVGLVRLRNNDTNRIFEMRWPRSSLADFVEEIRQGDVRVGGAQRDLDMSPSDVVRAGGRGIGSGA